MKLWNGMTYAEAHKKMWTDLGDNINLSEWEWIDNENKDNECIPCGVCFACEEAKDRNSNSKDKVCHCCPVCENTNTLEQCLNGLFAKWENAEHLEKAKLAYEIANLEWEDNHYPKIDDKYWLISTTGDIIEEQWTSEKYHKLVWDIGNIFLSKEEAIAEVEYRKTKNKLKMFAKKHNEEEIDWENLNQKKCYFFCDTINNRLGVNYYSYAKANDIYFTSEEIAKKAIEEIGEDNLIKYYFREGISGKK